jgi:CheY-like chemotaxis protein
LIPSDLWNEELAAVAHDRDVSRSELAAAVPPESDPASDPPPPADPAADDEAMAESASRLLRSAAVALDGAASRAIHADAMSVLVLVAELFDLPRLREWTARFSAADDRDERAPAAALIMLAAAEAVQSARRVAVLREHEWPWPELPAVEPPAPEPAIETSAEPVTLVFEPEPAPGEPVPPPAPVAAPLAPAHAGAQAPAPAAPTAPSAWHQPPRPQALILERSTIAASFLARQLTQRGLNVLVVTDPGAAARELAAGTFDFVFVDEDLPGGGETLLAAHPEWRDRAVLLGSSAGHRAGPAGVPVLAKPPADDEITHALASLALRRRPSSTSPPSENV